MKTILRLLFWTWGLCLFPQLLFGQVPESFSYQAVLRDGSGTLLNNQNIAVQFSILNSSGATVYQEIYSSVQTNQFALFTAQVGNGSPVIGIFSDIAWENGPYELEIQVDESGGTNFTFLGKSLLNSVPYALYANEVKVDRDSQLLSLNGNELTISNGNTISLPTGASAVPAFQQQIPTSIQNGNLEASTSTVDGDTMVLAVSGNFRQLARYTRDTITGQYYFSQSGGYPAAFSPISIAIIDDFIYLSGSQSGSTTVIRYPIDNLQSFTFMSFVGATPGQGRMFSDGNNLVIYDSGSGWTKFSLSGNSLVNQGTVVISFSSQIEGSLFDGLNVYHWIGSQIRATDVSGTAGGTKTIGSNWVNFASNSVGNTVGFVNIDPQRLYLVSGYRDATVNSQLIIVLTPFSKP